MTFDDLKFKVEDFEDTVTWMGFKSETVKHNYSESLANVVNRILREKLEKATAVYGRETSKAWEFWNYSDEHREEDTHTARLLCIEKIDKKK